jgi:hypothetical protein
MQLHFVANHPISLRVRVSISHPHVPFRLSSHPPLLLPPRRRVHRPLPQHPPSIYQQVPLSESPSPPRLSASFLPVFYSSSFADERTDMNLIAPYDRKPHQCQCPVLPFPNETDIPTSTMKHAFDGWLRYTKKPLSLVPVVSACYHLPKSLPHEEEAESIIPPHQKRIPYLRPKEDHR